MRTTLLRAALTVGLFGVVQAAEAQQQGQAQPRGGVRTAGAFTQSFEFRDGANLGSAGSTFRSLTGFDLNLSSLTPTSSVYASTGISLRADGNGFSLARPKLTLGFTNDTKEVKYDGKVTYSQAPIAVDEVLTDLSVLRVNADRTILSGSLGLSTKLNPSTNLSFGVNGTRIDFDPLTPSLSPTTDLGLKGRVTYRLNRRTSYGLDGSLGYFAADNATDTESLSATLKGNLSHDLTSVTSFDSNLGIAFIDTTDTVGTATTSAFSVSLLFGAGLTQQLPDGSMGVSVNQSINPSSSGALALGTQINGSMTRNVNPNETYTIGASLGRQEDVGGGAVTTFINVSPSYSRQLTRDVSATASYFFQRDDTGSSAQGLTLSFSRPFDFAVR